jgi:hypothetical protein
VDSDSARAATSSTFFMRISFNSVIGLLLTTRRDGMLDAVSRAQEKL